MKTNLNLDSALRTFARLTNLAKLNNRDKVTFSVTFSVPSSSLMRHVLFERATFLKAVGNSRVSARSTDLTTVVPTGPIRCSQCKTVS